MNDYLNYLTVERPTREAKPRAPHEPDVIPASVNSIIVREDSDFLAENFPDGIPNKLQKDDLSVKDAKIVALHVAGYKRREIAEMVGVSEGDVTLILRHPSAKKITEELTQKLLKETISTVKSGYIAHAQEALNTTLLMMRHSKNDRVRLEAARDISKGAGLFDERGNDSRTPLDPESAKIISNTLRELTEETKEFPALGNSAELDAIRAELEEADVVEEAIEASKHPR